jgi:hypothetical protein
MARPKPKIILERTDKRTYKSEQVLEADAVYSVYYQGKPINLRTLNSLVNYPGPKYRKVSFSNPAHCINLSKKLNKLFNTDQFTVRRFGMNDGMELDLDA